MPLTLILVVDCVDYRNSYPMILAASTSVISSGEGPWYFISPFASLATTTSWAIDKAVKY